MVESKNSLDEVLCKKTNHPNLLISHKTSCSQVKSILAQCRIKCGLHIINISIMQVFNFLFVGYINSARQVAAGDKDWSKLILILLKECVHLFEVGDATLNSFGQIFVCDLVILNIILFTVDQEQLEARLTISGTCRPLQKFDGLVDVASNTESFLIEYTHPVGTNEATLLSTQRVVLGGLLLVVLKFVLCVHKLSHGIASTGAFVSLHDHFQISLNFLDIRLLVKSNIIVCLIFNCSEMVVFDSFLKPILSFFNVLRDLIISAFNEESSQYISSIIVVVSINNVLELSLG
mmetsp:Transcript_45477/g.61699  ORF Transcript_45477/g.61699 Transcript_45477/m.61699 type:complete len:291 (-) Transcript_45477:78-950(-)